MKFKLLNYLCKFYKWKIENFFKNNSICFIISHFNENFDYLNILPSNQRIIIYIKDKIKKPLTKKKNIKFIFIPNYSREDFVYFYHLKKNYNKLSVINFFLIASFYNVSQIQKFRRFTAVYKKISNYSNKKKYNLYTSESDNVFHKLAYFKNIKKLKTVNPNFKKIIHISNGKKLKLIKAKKRPLKKWFEYYFPGKNFYHLSSMNGIFAVKRENIRQIPRIIFKKINNEYKQINKSYESAHYLERLYPSIFYY
jgi:hypothetical protein